MILKAILLNLLIWFGLDDKVYPDSKDTIPLPVQTDSKDGIDYSSKDAKAVIEDFPRHDLMERWYVPEPPPIVHPPCLSDVNPKSR